MKFGLLK
jgi:hypothetical protein